MVQSIQQSNSIHDLCCCTLTSSHISGKRKYGCFAMNSGLCLHSKMQITWLLLIMKQTDYMLLLFHYQIIQKISLLVSHAFHAKENSLHRIS